MAGYKGSTFITLCRGEKNDLICGIQLEEQLGAQGAEGFFHGAVLVFAYGKVLFLILLVMRKLC